MHATNVREEKDGHNIIIFEELRELKQGCVFLGLFCKLLHFCIFSKVI